jgi:hypothetical protein
MFIVFDKLLALSQVYFLEVGKMIAIQTKYIGASNTKGSRIKAWTVNGQSVTIPFPHEFSNEKCHFQAVKALVEKYGLEWDISNMRFGGVKEGYVFCFSDSIIQ